MTRVLRAAVLVGVGLLVGGGAWAQESDEPVVEQPVLIAPPKPAQRHLPHVSSAQYLAQLTAEQGLIAACKENADTCDESKVDADVTVEAGATRFDARRGWLRDALTEGKKQNEADRAGAMDQAAARLTEDAAEVGDTATGASAPGVSERDARGKANAILGRTEFRSVEESNYLTRQIAALSFLLERFIDGIGNHLPHAPWLVVVIEWSILGGAAAGLLLWAWRTTRQQRLALAAPMAERQTVWQKESDDWARRAEAEAARGEWREAVHSLYWAAIVLLEGRKLWRANRARTPREYLPLLEAGSARQRALGGLTRILERLWYGLRPASQSDFERAQALLEELKAA